MISTWVCDSALCNLLLTPPPPHAPVPLAAHMVLQPHCPLRCSRPGNLSCAIVTTPWTGVYVTEGKLWRSTNYRYTVPCSF